MREIALKIADGLELGEQLYWDVYWVALGKLLDKQKLLGCKLKRSEITVNINYLTDRVGEVMSSFVNVGPDLMKDTADYYRRKYSQYDITTAVT